MYPFNKVFNVRDKIIFSYPDPDVEKDDVNPKPSSQATKDESIPKPSGQAKKDEMIPKLSGQVTKDEIIPKPTGQATKDEMIPKPSGQATKDDVNPKPSSQTTKDETIPKPTGQTTKNEIIPKPSSQATKDEINPKPSGPATKDDVNPKPSGPPTKDEMISKPSGQETKDVKTKANPPPRAQENETKIKVLLPQKPNRKENSEDYIVKTKPDSFLKADSDGIDNSTSEKNTEVEDHAAVCDQEIISVQIEEIGWKSTASSVFEHVTMTQNEGSGVTKNGDASAEEYTLNSGIDVLTTESTSDPIQVYESPTTAFAALTGPSLLQADSEISIGVTDRTSNTTDITTATSDNQEESTTNNPVDFHQVTLVTTENPSESSEDISVRLIEKTDTFTDSATVTTETTIVTGIIDHEEKDTTVGSPIDSKEKDEAIEVSYYTPGESSKVSLEIATESEISVWVPEVVAYELLNEIPRTSAKHSKAKLTPIEFPIDENELQGSTIDSLDPSTDVSVQKNFKKTTARDNSPTVTYETSTSIYDVPASKMTDDTEISIEEGTTSVHIDIATVTEVFENSTSIRDIPITTEIDMIEDTVLINVLDLPEETGTDTDAFEYTSEVFMDSTESLESETMTEDSRGDILTEPLTDSLPLNGKDELYETVTAVSEDFAEKETELSLRVINSFEKTTIDPTEIFTTVDTIANLFEGVTIGTGSELPEDDIPERLTITNTFTEPSEEFMDSTESLESETVTEDSRDGIIDILTETFAVSLYDKNEIYENETTTPESSSKSETDFSSLQVMNSFQNVTTDSFEADTVTNSFDWATITEMPEDPLDDIVKISEIVNDSFQDETEMASKSGGLIQDYLDLETNVDTKQFEMLYESYQSLLDHIEDLNDHS